MGFVHSSGSPPPPEDDKQCIPNEESVFYLKTDTLATARETQPGHWDTTSRLGLPKLLLTAHVGSHFIQSLYFPQSY